MRYVWVMVKEGIQKTEAKCRRKLNTDWFIICYPGISASNENTTPRSV